ncbi:hypothetical protein EEB14_33370 [Rhodococcus sp. WS4]|nr:hypothetical protein EEB14_33370 [Rhodococcus sp. WS4]
MSFANFAVEAGIFTGIGNPRLIDLPLTGGMGVSAANLLTIAGIVLICDRSIYASTAIRWTKSEESPDAESAR